MEFYSNQYFHVYNQGNNRRKIFLSRDNYNFFLFKAATYILPFADIVAYCLMPNHYHLLIFVKQTSISRIGFKNFCDNYQANYFKNKNVKYKGYRSQINTRKSTKFTLNEAIAILQRSYTRALNNEHKWSGSLFRDGCKAKDSWEDKFITLGDENFFMGNEYVLRCFEYIHNNPVSSGLVDNSLDWEFSSAKDYYSDRKPSICNLKLGQPLIRN